MTGDETKSSVRVVATLPWGIYAELEQIAEKEARAVGNLAGAILEMWVRSEQERRSSTSDIRAEELLEKLDVLIDKVSEKSSSDEHRNRNHHRKEQAHLTSIIQAVKSHFKPALHSDSDDSYRQEWKKWDIQYGFQESEFTQFIVFAGEYAPIVIPLIFKRIGPLPPSGSLGTGKKPEDAYYSILENICFCVKENDIFRLDADWLEKCKKAIHDSIEYVDEPEYTRCQGQPGDHESSYVLPGDDEDVPF
jgi:hypothetical protein